MAEEQKQLQDLSDEYQKLQGGTSLSHMVQQQYRKITNEIPQSFSLTLRHVKSWRPNSKRIKAFARLANWSIAYLWRLLTLTLWLQEFAKLAEDANIYKLVGPVLLKQEKSEAILAVNGRLEYIEKEMCVLFSTALLTTNDLTGL